MILDEAIFILFYSPSESMTYFVCLVQDQERAGKRSEKGRGDMVCSERCRTAFRMVAFLQHTTLFSF